MMVASTGRSARGDGQDQRDDRDIVQAKLFGRAEGSGVKRRFAGTGLVMVTFTPLEGVSEMVTSFLQAQGEGAGA